MAEKSKTESGDIPITPERAARAIEDLRKEEEARAPETNKWISGGKTVLGKILKGAWVVLKTMFKVLIVAVAIAAEKGFKYLDKGTGKLFGKKQEKKEEKKSK